MIMSFFVLRSQDIFFMRLWKEGHLNYLRVWAHAGTRHADWVAKHQPLKLETIQGFFFPWAEIEATGRYLSKTVTNITLLTVFLLALYYPANKIQPFYKFLD